MISKHKKLLLLLALISVLIAIPLAKVNAAATITVNSTADNQSNDGACTLREAIVASNTDTASGAAVGECVAGSGAGDLIEFDISGSGLKTIHITSGLPSITRTVTIDGYTQTDASVNTADFPDAMNGTLTVEIDAEGESGIYGIDISGSQADGTVIKGLIVNDIPYETFYLTDVDNVSIEGNYIGTSSTGNTADGGNSHGIRIGGSSTGNMIGGATAAKRNVISGNGNTGVLFYGSAQTTGNFVQGNYIGIGANGSSDVGNTQVGVASMEGPVANTIGGDGAGEGNVISGNGGVGITFISNSGGSNIIQGNYIGVGGDGSTAVPNGASGILIENGSDSNTVGGSSSGARNIISGNVEAGIFISGPTADSNTVVGNYIGTDNTGAVDVGNGLYGVVLDNSPSNIVGGTTGVTVGGDCTGECNVISGNGDDGIWFYGDNADNNVIQGNHIGTDVGNGFSSYYVNGGTFIANAINTSLGLSPFSISAGVLGGTDVIGPVSAYAGTIAPGNSPGCLNPAGDVAFTEFSTLSIQINGTTACTEYDFLSASGAIALNDAQLVVELPVDYVSHYGDAFMIVQGSVLAGTFASLADGDTVAVGPYSFRINYTSREVILTDITQDSSGSTESDSSSGSDTLANTGISQIFFGVVAVALLSGSLAVIRKQRS